MSDSANIRSVEAIERLRVTVLEFAASCQDGLDEMDQVMRRIVDWLEHDRPRYWKEAIRERQRHLHEARQQLARCLMFSMQDEHPACREERGAVRKAEAAVTEGEQKAERVRHYRQLIQQEMFEFEGRLGHFASVVTNDIPRAANALERIMQQIESYRQTNSPGLDAEPTPEASRDATGSEVGGARQSAATEMVGPQSGKAHETEASDVGAMEPRDTVRGGSHERDSDPERSSEGRGS